VGYRETFDVRVLDAMQRPVEGAEVTVTYDRGATFGEQYFTTPVKYSDSNGKVHFDLINQGTTARKIDCDIDVVATSGGSTGKKTVEAEKHGPIVDVILSDVYPVRFYVRDHLGAAIPNATVIIGERTDLTNEYGYVKHYMKKGSHTYLATYLEAKESGTMEVENDTEFVVTFPYYKVTIDVMDDFSVPLDATITMFNKTFLLEDGHYENPRSFGQEISYEVEYKGLKQSGTIVPELDPSIQIVYDIHAPVFEDIQSQTTGDRATLNVEVTDPGDHPSGVDVSSISITYRMEPADPTTPWNMAVVFPTGFNRFTAEFSDLPPESVVQFKIDIKDKTGNRATIEGKFSTLVVEPPVNDTVNDTQNQTITQNGEDTGQEIPLFYIIVGGILAFLIIYWVIRIKSKGTRGV
jgi:hypothetical protein